MSYKVVTVVSHIWDARTSLKPEDLGLKEAPPKEVAGLVNRGSELSRKCRAAGPTDRRVPQGAGLASCKLPDAIWIVA